MRVLRVLRVLRVVRVANPRNHDVRGVRRRKFNNLDSARQMHKILLTVPPLARRLCQVHWRLDLLCAALVPWLRTHRLSMLQKAG